MNKNFWLKYQQSNNKLRGAAVDKLFLVGARGAGKSTVGALLAARLGCPFVDTDDELCTRSGASVAEIVAREGWPGFRQREGAVLRRVGRRQGPAVIATGGGMVLLRANRSFMRSAGRVIYICARPGELARRLAGDPRHAQRPSLTGAPLLEELASVLAEREALYREAAHHAVDGALPAGEVLEQIMGALGAGGGSTAI